MRWYLFLLIAFMTILVFGFVLVSWFAISFDLIHTYIHTLAAIQSLVVVFSSLGSFIFIEVVGSPSVSVCASHQTLCSTHQNNDNKKTRRNQFLMVADDVFDFGNGGNWWYRCVFVCWLNCWVYRARPSTGPLFSYTVFLSSDCVHVPLPMSLYVWAMYSCGFVSLCSCVHINFCWCCCFGSIRLLICFSCADLNSNDNSRATGRHTNNSIITATTTVKR